MMKYRVKVLRTLKSEETEIGIGAVVLLRCASRPIIKLLRENYHKDKSCLMGDIPFLFAFDGVGIEKKEKYFKP